MKLIHSPLALVVLVVTTAITFSAIDACASDGNDYSVRFRARFGWHHWLEDEPRSLSNLSGNHGGGSFEYLITEGLSVGLEYNRYHRERPLARLETQVPGADAPTVNSTITTTGLFIGYRFTFGRFHPYVAGGVGVVFEETDILVPFFDFTTSEYTYASDESHTYGNLILGCDYSFAERFTFFVEADLHIGSDMNWDVLGEPQYIAIQSAIGVSFSL